MANQSSEQDMEPCYEDHTSLPVKSNHYFTDEDFDNPQTALCRKCAKPMIEWLAGIQRSLIAAREGDLLSRDG